MAAVSGARTATPAPVTAVRRPVRATAAVVLLRFCRKKPLGAVGGFIMLLIVFTAIFANVLQTQDPIATNAADTLARPSAAHWLGTDHLGRDIYSRILHGARVSLLVGLGSTAVASLLGGVIGLLSGYVGGKTDLVVQRIMDILQGLPLLVLALVMSAALGPSIPNVILAISIPIMPRAARVIRASVLSIREFQYVEAARPRRPTPAHRLPPHPAQYHRPLHRACHRPARQRHPRGGDAVLPRPGCARAVSLVGTHALRVGRGVRAEGALARALPRHGHQPGRVRIESARRRASRHAGPAPSGRLTLPSTEEEDMASDGLCWMPASEMAAAIRRKKISPVEVMKAVLARIERLNPTLNAFVTLTAEQAMRDARAAERALGKRGTTLGPLHGVPFSTKDLVNTRNIRTTFGTRLYADNVPTETAPIVERMLAAGAIQLGKTNTPTFGWIGATHNLLFGVTRNPWNLDRTPGGSSGGASAAVAAGLGPLAIGTDGGGSIRIPASFTGIVGHKASFGRIPVQPGSAVWSLSHVGPMTRTVTDAALMMNVCAGPDSRDSLSLPA